MLYFNLITLLSFMWVCFVFNFSLFNRCSFSSFFFQPLAFVHLLFNGFYSLFTLYLLFTVLFWCNSVDKLHLKWLYVRFSALSVGDMCIWNEQLWIVWEIICQIISSLWVECVFPLENGTNHHQKHVFKKKILCVNDKIYRTLSKMEWKKYDCGAKKKNNNDMVINKTLNTASSPHSHPIVLEMNNSTYALTHTIESHSHC